MTNEKWMTIGNQVNTTTTVKTVITNTIRISLNLSKKQSSKDTILGYTHNGVIYNNTKDDTSFINFRLVSQKQGAVKMTGFNHEGASSDIDATKFLNHLFDGEAPDVKFTADLGATDAIEDAIENGARCLILDVPVDQLQPNGMNDRGWMNFRLGRVSVSFSGEVIGRHSVDIKWVMNALSNSVVTELCGREYLSRFRKAQTKVEAVKESDSTPVQTSTTPGTEMANKTKEEARPANKVDTLALINAAKLVSQSDLLTSEEVNEEDTKSLLDTSTETVAEEVTEEVTPVVEETTVSTEVPEGWVTGEEEEEPAEEPTDEFDVDAFGAPEDETPEATTQGAIDILANLKKTRPVVDYNAMS